MTLTFEEFIKKGVARRISPDIERSKNLADNGRRRFLSIPERADKLGVTDQNSNDHVEFCYDTMMILVRAHMLREGFTSSGHQAHEAEVAYMRKLGFQEAEVDFADKLRYFRNGILYYGTALDAEYAKKVIRFAKKAYDSLNKGI